MESVFLDDLGDSTDSDWVLADARFDAPATPSSTSDDGPQPPASIDSEDEDPAKAGGELVPRTKPGGYDSRVEQILYEHPDIPIIITDAGKSVENLGRHIVYTIRTAVLLLCPLPLPVPGS
jgi:sorting nexin-41/42